jgi:hypothetical protein
VENRLGCGEKRRCRREKELEQTEEVRENKRSWKIESGRRILQVILSD